MTFRSRQQSVKIDKIWVMLNNRKYIESSSTITNNRACCVQQLKNRLNDCEQQTNECIIFNNIKYIVDVQQQTKGYIEHFYVTNIVPRNKFNAMCCNRNPRITVSLQGVGLLPGRFQMLISSNIARRGGFYSYFSTVELPLLPIYPLPPPVIPFSITYFNKLIPA